MDNRLKRLVEELGSAINESISTSAGISGVIEQIEGSGYHILLFLNATIALIKQDEVAEQNSRHECGLNAEDVQFLKSMHISASK